MQIVGVEILVRWRAGEEQVEQFENQELERRLAFTVQKKDDVLAKALVCGTICSENLDDPVCRRRAGRLPLIGHRAVCRHHVLLVQDQLLHISTSVSAACLGEDPDQNSYDRIMVGIGHVIREALDDLEHVRDEVVVDGH